MYYRISLLIFFSALQIGKFDDYSAAASKSVNDEDNSSTINATYGRNNTIENPSSQNVSQSEVLLQTNITEEGDSDNETIVQTANETSNQSFSSETNSSQEYDTLNLNETTTNETIISIQSLNSMTTTSGPQPPEGKMDRTLKPEKLEEWMKITPGFFSEPMCVVERGWWLSNVKLSLNDTYINPFKCTILYCCPNATITSYTCEFLNSTLVPSLKTDVRRKEALEKCTKMHCI